MTIAIALKVEDGIVLAADSASTLVTGDGGVANVYNHADKIVNLRKGLPVGIAFWGAGSIGGASMTTLAKDLRLKLTDADSDWAIDPKSYSVEAIAGRVKEHFLDEHYSRSFDEPTNGPGLGMFVVGYSSGHMGSECYEVGVDPERGFVGPELMLHEEDSGLLWRGEPEAVMRLVVGFGSEMVGALKTMGLTKNDEIDTAMNVMRDHLEVSLLHPAMPIQDAIDLGTLLVEVTKQWSRFVPGAPTVGGPAEVAAITKHEGFKWVQRKHYYDQRLNPFLTDGR